MKKLHTIFLNSEGKKHTLQPKVFDENLTADQVRGAMEKLIALDISEYEGIQYYQEAASAKYVETIETPLF